MGNYVAKQDRYQHTVYNRCGQSGLRLPPVSLGLWHNFGDTGDYENKKALLFTAFDSGITHFDLANNYGPPPGEAERSFGRILREELSAYRDEMILSTKAGYTMWEGPYGDGGSRKYLISSLDQSLQRMGLSYVDIFYHHRPDKDTPLSETMEALSDIVKSGKALYIGLSNYTGEQMKEAKALLDALHCPYIINQNSYSALNRTVEKNGLLSASRAAGIGVIAFSPLLQGLLGGRYRNGIPADSRIRTDGRFLKEASLSREMLSKLEAYYAVADARGDSPAALAVRWLLSQSGVTSVLIGASKPAQITDCLKGCVGTPLSAEELAEIDRLTC